MKKRRRQGQTLVEFALILPILLAILIGIFEFGRIIFLYANLFNAAREGARYGLTHPQDYNGILQSAQDKVALAQLTPGSDLTVHLDTGPNSGDICTMAANDDCGPYAVVGNRVRVEVAMGVSPITPFFETFVSNLTLRTGAARTIQRVSPTVSTPPPTAPPQDSDGMPVLSATKSASPNSAEPGQTISYNIVISNDGTAEATGVSFSDTVDENTTLVPNSLTSTHGTVTESGNTISVDIGTIPSDSQVTIQYQVTVNDPLPAGVVQITNQGVVASNEQDDVATNPASTAVTSDLSVTATKSSYPSIAQPEDVVGYTITIYNTGNQGVTGITLSDTPDANTDLNVGTVTASQGSVVSGNDAGDTTVEVDVGTLAAGEQATVEFQVTVDPLLPETVEEIVNECTVTSSEADPASATAITEITMAPDLVGRKVATPQDLNRNGITDPGDEILYEITLENIGNQRATNVVLSDSLNGNTSLVGGSLSTSQGSATEGSNSVTVDVGAMDPETWADISFRVKVNGLSQSAIIDNQGTMSCDELPDEATNRTEVAATIPLFIDKPVFAGDTEVTGVAAPGETVVLQVLRTSYEIQTTVGSDGTFVFNDAAMGLAEGEYVLVKYRDFNTQDIARVEAAPTGQYIRTTGVSCSTEPVTVTIEGFDWPLSSELPSKYSKSTGIVLFCDGQEWYSPVDAYDGSGSFTYTGVPFTAQCPADAPHTIMAKAYGDYDKTSKREALTPVESYEYTLEADTFCAVEPDLPPDIKVESLTVANAGEIGTYEPITVTVVLSNTTSTDVTSLFEVDLFADPAEDTLLLEQISVDHVGIQVLEGGSRVTFEMYASAGFTSTGEHVLALKADTFEQIAEESEENNVLTTTVGISTTNAAPTPTPTEVVSDTGSIAGETWLYVQNELLPQSGVSVYAVNTASGTTYGPVLSDDRAEYTLEGLPAGTYAVTGEYEMLEDTDNDGELERVTYSNTVNVTLDAGEAMMDVYLILEP